MKILGMDIATVCGIAISDTAKPVSAIIPSSFRLQGRTDEEKAADMARHMVSLIRDHRPDLVAIEAPLKNVVRHRKQKRDLLGVHEEETINPASVTLPNQLVGAVIAVCTVMGIPYATIAIATWRAQFLGEGTKRGRSRKEWKRAARDRCEQLGIVVSNDDQAEACGVAFAAPATAMFRELRHRRAA